MAERQPRVCRKGRMVGTAGKGASGCTEAVWEREGSRSGTKAQCETGFAVQRRVAPEAMDVTRQSMWHRFIPSSLDPQSISLTAVIAPVSSILSTAVIDHLAEVYH